MKSSPARGSVAIVAALAAIVATFLADPQVAGAATPAPTPSATATTTATPSATPDSSTPSPNPNPTPDSTTGIDPTDDQGNYDPPSDQERSELPDADPTEIDAAEIPMVQARSQARTSCSSRKPITFGVAGASFTQGTSSDGDDVLGTYLTESNVDQASWAYHTTRDPYLHLNGGWALAGSTVGDLTHKIRPDMYRPGSYVVILAGTNDQFRNTTPQQSMRDMATLIDRTGVAKNKVLLVTLPPIRGFEQRVINFNNALKAFGSANGIRVLDLHPTMSDGYYWRPGYTFDGIHFNPPQVFTAGNMIADALNDMSQCPDNEFNNVASRADLGPATTPIHSRLRDYGKFRHHRIGSVYVSNKTPATPVKGRIRDKWASMGWENGLPGYPIEPERCGYVRGGCFSVFERASIYWSPATGAVEIHGATRDLWGRMGYENGWLGYPTADKFCGLRDGGCFQRFEGGYIYWNRATGAHAVRGRIFDRWGHSAYERGWLGYPTSSEHCGLRQGGCFTHFQGGSIYWTLGTDAKAVKGKIRERWSQMGWERSSLGYPVSEEHCDKRGCTQRFQRGSLYYRWGTPRAVVR